MSTYAGTHNGGTHQGTSKHDWGMFASGLFLIAFAFVIMLWPGITLITLAVMAGVLFLFAGGVDLSTYFRVRKVAQGSGWILVNAILDIILGAMFVIHPFASAQVLPWLAGAFTIAYGIMVIISSIAFRSYGSGWAMLLLYGILSIAIGFFFIASPAYFVLFLGIFLAMRGALMAFYGIVSPRSLPYM